MAQLAAILAPLGVAFLDKFVSNLAEDDDEEDDDEYGGKCGKGKRKRRAGRLNFNPITGKFDPLKHTLTEIQPSKGKGRGVGKKRRVSRRKKTVKK